MTLTPIKAIRAKCKDCCCGQLKEVALCTVTKCSLHPYRMGHRPKDATAENTNAAAGSAENFDIEN